MNESEVILKLSDLSHFIKKLVLFGRENEIFFIEISFFF
jgi:hypothetical protein